MQKRAKARYELSDTWLAAGCWSIWTFSQRLIHYTACFPKVEIQHIFLFKHVCQLSGFIRALFRIHLLRFSQCRSMNETILALLKQQLVHVFCEPNFWAITQISGWGFWLCSSDLIFPPVFPFFCIGCQSRVVTLNHLQTELAPVVQSFPFTRLLPRPTCQNDTHCWPSFLFSTGKLIGFSGLNQQSMSVSPT